MVFVIICWLVRSQERNWHSCVLLCYVFLFQADEIEKILCHKFTNFMMQRAEHFTIMRRKPIQVSVGVTLSYGLFLQESCLLRM